jgi:ribose/xylose/arabinose/galactoside ABC-type transport system permease subunit
MQTLCLTTVDRYSIVLFGGLAADLIVAVMVRRQRAPFRLALLAFLLVVATLVIFFTWTYPANQATSNWTVVPADWQELRTQWEYAHATNAVLTFLALCALTWSVLLTRD